MALPFGPPLLPKAEAACPQWQDTQEIVEAQAPQVRWMSIWCSDQANLARQRVVIFSKKSLSPPSWGDSLSQSNGIDRGGIFAQLKGSLTKKRYRYCTVFVDNFSLCITCTSKLTTLLQRPCLPSKRLKNLQLSMMFASYTITVITNDLLTMPGSNHARPAANNLLSAE
jgi:hypothetical protein